MALPYETDDFIRTLAVMAENVRKELEHHPSATKKGHADFSVVREIVASADVVVGVWFDFTQPNGVGTMIVKGAPILRRVVRLGRKESPHIAAIPCTCIEQAEALRLHIAQELEKAA